MVSGFDVVGLIGSFMISVGLVPQVSKVFRTKSANDISYSFLFMYNTGLALVVTYGIGESLWPIYIPCSMELLGAIALLFMKCMYSDRVKKDDEDLEAAPSTPKTQFLAASTS